MKEIVFLIDTREQLPYRLEPFEKAKLDEGDYSVKGLKGVVAIERKTLPDYIGSITAGRARFFRELDRVLSTPEKDSGYRFFAIVVEGNLFDILKHNYRSKAHPSSILGTTARLLLMGIPVVFAGTREAGRKMTERLLRKAWEDHNENQN